MYCFCCVCLLIEGKSWMPVGFGSGLVGFGHICRDALIWNNSIKETPALRYKYMIYHLSLCCEITSDNSRSETLNHFNPTVPLTVQRSYRQTCLQLQPSFRDMLPVLYRATELKTSSIPPRLCVCVCVCVCPALPLWKVGGGSMGLGLWGMWGMWEQTSWSQRGHNPNSSNTHQPRQTLSIRCSELLQRRRHVISVFRSSLWVEEAVEDVAICSVWSRGTEALPAIWIHSGFYIHLRYKDVKGYV